MKELPSSAEFASYLTENYKGRELEMLDIIEYFYEHIYPYALKNSVLYIYMTSVRKIIENKL
jgi:hypothetical protein